MYSHHPVSHSHHPQQPGFYYNPSSQPIYHQAAPTSYQQPYNLTQMQHVPIPPQQQQQQQPQQQPSSFDNMDGVVDDAAEDQLPSSQGDGL